MAIQNRRRMNTGPIFLSSSGGPTMKDMLGVAGSRFRGAPHFGNVPFVGLVGQQIPGSWTQGGGQHPLGEYNPANRFGGAETDPRDRGIDPRLSREDPRDRSRAAQQLAMEDSLAAAQMTATEQSLAQLRAMAQMQGGQGMPQAAWGGRYSGPVRVHGGEIVQPSPDGGVEVLNPEQAAWVEEQVAASNNRVDDRVAARARRVQDAGFRQVAGSPPLAPSTNPADMDRILSGELHPDQAEPEVRQAFMQRMTEDPRFSNEVRGRWASAQRGPSIEEQRAAATRFAEDMAAREAAMPPEEIAARDERRGVRDRRLSAALSERRASESAAAATRREALVRDVPLDVVRGEDAAYGITDVLFERTRNRRQGVDLGVDPTTSGRLRRDITEGYRARRANEEIGMVAAMNRGGGYDTRAQTAVTTQQLNGLARIIASPDASPEQREWAQQQWDAITQGGGGEFPTSPVGMGAGGMGQVGMERVPGLAEASDAAKRAYMDVLRPAAVPDPADPARSVQMIRGEEDFQILSDIEGDWIGDPSPVKLQGYYQSFDRITDLLADAGRIEDKAARRFVLEQINERLSRYGFDRFDAAVGNSPELANLVSGKKAITEIVSEMLNGRRPPPSRFQHLKKQYRAKEDPFVTVQR